MITEIPVKNIGNNQVVCAECQDLDKREKGKIDYCFLNTFPSFSITRVNYVLSTMAVLSESYLSKC